MKNTLIFILSFLAVNDAQDAKKVEVSVYYESKCPDSRQFFLKQLYPVWRDLKDILNLTLTSYGKTKEAETRDGDYTFSCQHGSEECEGNMLLTCASYHINDQTQAMDFARCIMHEYQGAQAGLQCAKENSVDYGAIRDCHQSSEGRTLQHLAGRRQARLSPSLYYVPWIVINETPLPQVFTDEMLEAAQADLKGVVCDAYEGQKPTACSD